MIDLTQPPRAKRVSTHVASNGNRVTKVNLLGGFLQIEYEHSAQAEAK